MLAADIEDALRLWALWARQGDIGPRILRTCGSAERHYLAEAGEVFAECVEPDDPIVADDIGLRVERAVLAIGDPFRTIIVLIYVKRLPLEIIARRLRIRDPRQVLYDARAMLAHRLGQRAPLRYEVASYPGMSARI